MADTSTPIPTKDTIDIAAQIVKWAKEHTSEFQKQKKFTDDIATNIGLYVDQATKIGKITDNISVTLEEIAKLEADKNKSLKDRIEKTSAIQALDHQIFADEDAGFSLLNEEMKKNRKNARDLIEGELKLLDAVLLKNHDNLDVAENMRNVLEEEYKQRLKIEFTLKTSKDIMSNMLAITGEGGAAMKGFAEGIISAATGAKRMVAIIGIAVQYIKLAVDRFVLLQKAAEEFRLTTGLTIGQSKELTAQAEDLNRNYQQFGVTAKIAYDSIAAMMETIGNVKVVKNMAGMSEASALLKTNFGVAQKDSTGFMYNMMKTGDVTEAGAASMTVYAAKLAKAAGVGLPKVMKDVAAASGVTLAMVRGSAIELIKAAVAASRLGVNLSESSKSARQLLNFYDSINAEMEASVLTGKVLNFQEARRLSWAGKFAEAQEEVLKQVESVGDFTKMNIYQQEALAKVSGYSLDDLYKMAKTKKLIAGLDGDQKKKYDAMMKVRTKTAEEERKEFLQQKNMQSVISNISNSFQRILNTLADGLGPAIWVISKILEGVAYVLDKIISSTANWLGGAGKIIGIIASIAVGMALLKAGVWSFGKILTSLVGNVFEKVFSSIGTGIKSVMEAIGSIDPKKLLMGVAALLGISVAIWISAKAFKEFSGVKWESVLVGLGMLGLFAFAAGIMGGFAPAILAGAGVIAVLGVALAVFDIMTKPFLASIPTLVSSFDAMVTAIIKLNKLDWDTILFKLPLLGASLLLFSTALAAASVSSFLGGSIITKLEKLVSLQGGLSMVADSLACIAESLKDISNIKIDIRNIKELSDELGNLKTELKLNYSNAAGKTENTDTNSALLKAVNKLNEELDHGIRVYLNQRLLNIESARYARINST